MRVRSLSPISVNRSLPSSLIHRSVIPRADLDFWAIFRLHPPITKIGGGGPPPEFRLKQALLRDTVTIRNAFAKGPPPLFRPFLAIFKPKMHWGGDPGALRSCLGPTQGGSHLAVSRLGCTRER